MKRALRSLLGAPTLLALALALCGIAMAAPSSARSGWRGAKCGPAGARTLASSTEARVYALNGAVFGCAGKRQFRLGAQPGPDARENVVHPVVVVGRLAAYGSVAWGYDFADAFVIVRNLADGKRLFYGRAITDYQSAEPVESVGSLVAAPDGHVAWIVVAHFVAGGQLRIEVHRGRMVLDDGRTIHAHSLKLHGTLLSWKHGSRTRHARLR